MQERDGAITPEALLRTADGVRSVPVQPTPTVQTPTPGAPTTSVQLAAATPAALMGLGTRALATALVVHSAPPGYLRGALAALEGTAAR